MPQKNAFIIDEDREFALMVAAALRTEGLKITIFEGDRDPLDVIRAERPDMVVARAESSGKESGYTLCSRVKRNKRTQSTLVLLYTADPNQQTIETHKTKETRADEYVMLPSAPPYPLDELRDRVHNALFPPGGLQNPPPLPPQPKEELKPVTQEDTAFIEKVMDSLTSSREAEDLPPVGSRPPGALPTRRTTADAKLDMLREKLRQRESDLSRVMEMYRAKEREYHQFHERLVEKDVEAQSLKMTIDELSVQLETTKEELDRRTNEFNESFELLLEEKINRENELIQVVAGKEKEIADLKAEMAEAERTARVRIEALESSLAELDEEKHKLEGEVTQLKELIAEREGAIDALRQELDDAAHRERGLEKVRDDQILKILENEERMLALEGTILELRSDLSAERELAEREATEQLHALLQKDELADGLRADLAEADVAYRNLDVELHAAIADLSARLETKSRDHDELGAKKAELEAEYAASRAEWTERRTFLEGELATRTSELDAERIARAASEDSLSADLAAAEGRIEVLTLERERREIEVERIHRELTATLKAREETIEGLERTLREVREELERTDRTLKAEIDRLESARISTEHTLAEREDELGTRIRELEGTLASREAELAERGAELDRLGQELREHKDKISSLEMQLDEEGERFRELEAEGKADHARLTGDIAKLEADLARTKGEAEALEGELRDQIIQLGIDLAAKGDEIDTLQKELEGERRERSFAERSASSLSETLASTRAELDTTEDSLRARERDLGSLRETLADREARLAEMQEAFQAERNDRQSKEEQLGRLRSDYDQRASELGRLEGRIFVLDENLTGLRREKEELGLALTTTRTELGIQTAALAAARAEANERGLRLEEDARVLKQREDELQRARDQISELLGERERHGKEHEALRAERDRGLEEISRLGARGTELGVELEDVRERANELEAEVESRGRKIEVLTHDLSQSDEVRAALDRTRMTLTGDLARAEEALSRLQAELERARVEWAESRAALTQDRDAARARMVELGKELDDTRDQRDQALHAKAIFEEQANARGRMDAQAQAALTKEVEALRAERTAREAEIQVELESREGHIRELDREISATRDDLEAQRAAYEKATREIENLVRNLGETRASLEETSHQATLDKQHLSATVSTLEGELSALRNAHEDMRASYEAQVGSLNQHVDGLERTIATEREGREKDRERFRAESHTLAERLEEATSRGAALAANRQSTEERRVAELSDRDRQIVDLMRLLEERKHDGLRQQQDFAERVAAQQAELARLKEAIEEGRREREELDARYLKEFEEAQENFIRQAKEKEAAHAREVEELRAQKLEITRQLRTSQLAAQRLTDRVQKLETERPLTKSGAEEEFDSFLRQLDPPLRRVAGTDPDGSKLPVPSAVPAPARIPPRAGGAQPPSTTKPGAAALAASRVAAMQARRTQTGDLPTPPAGQAPGASGGAAGSAPEQPAQPGQPGRPMRPTDAVEATVVGTLGAAALGAPAGIGEEMAEEVTRGDNDATFVGTVLPPEHGQKAVRRPPPPPRRPIVQQRTPKSSGLAEDLATPDAPQKEPAHDEFLAAFEREFEDLKKT